MCKQCNNGITLVRGNPFVWTREENGSIAVRSACGQAVRIELSGEQYSEVIDLLTSRRDGTRLGAGETADTEEISLGNHLAAYGKSRSQATRIAAIAVEEGLADADFRGNKNGGLWLLPPEEAGDRASAARRDPRARSVATAVRPSAFGPDAAGTAAALHALGERAAATETTGERNFLFDLTDIRGSNTAEVLGLIKAWEQETKGARFLYRFRVDEADDARSCRDALSKGKSSGDQGRRFSRLNGHQSDSRCLYVGSSRSLTNRVRQHLGLSHKGTYAMQIAHWRSDEPLNGALHLDVARLEPETESAVLQALEDHLWLTERPWFGKQGAR